MLQLLEDKIDKLLWELRRMSTAFDNLKTAVEAQTTVVGSVTTLITSLAQQIHAVADDPAQVQALADQISQNSASLAQAVSANTPASPGTIDPLTTG